MKRLAELHIVCRECDGISLNDPFFIEAFLTSEPEDRWAVVGRLGKSDYLTAIVAHRDGKVHIISARKSTKKEVDVYGKN